MPSEPHRPRVPQQASPESQEQEQAAKDRVATLVARWQRQHGPSLRTLLAALDAPELGAIFGLCRDVCTKLPKGSDEAAVRRAYLNAIKRVHPDKLSAHAPAQERFAAAAVFDALRVASESAVPKLPQRRPRRNYYTTQNAAASRVSGLSPAPKRAPANHLSDVLFRYNNTFT